MLSFNPCCWLALHITSTPTFGEFMPTGSPQLVELWSCVSAPLLSHTPHRRRTGGSRGATKRGVWPDLGGVFPVDFMAQRTILSSFYIYLIFVRLWLYCDIYLYTLCYYICCLLWRMYEMHPTLSLKSGCDTMSEAKCCGNQVGVSK
jgi:hypothetical protein